MRIFLYDVQNLNGFIQGAWLYGRLRFALFWRTTAAALCIVDTVSGADSWWTVQTDMEEASTVILGVSRDGCVFHVLSWMSSGQISDGSAFREVDRYGEPLLSCGFCDILFSGFYYFRTSVADRSSQLRCPFTVADMVTHDLLWIRGSYLCRFSVDDGSA
jgi:hypothetical protein